MRDIDAFNSEIIVDPDCPGVQELLKEIDQFTIKELKECFPKEIFWANKTFEREKRSIEILKQMEHTKEIDLEDKFSFEDFNEALKEWDRKIIEIDDDTYFSEIREEICKRHSGQKSVPNSDRKRKKTINEVIREILLI